MINAWLSKFRRNFIRNEDGNASVEFVLVFPVYLSIMLFSIELGMVTLRATLLERGMDMAVRDIRLGTGTFGNDQKVFHDLIKDEVCNNSIFILDCKNNLRLEMASADIRSFASLDTTIDCTDRAETSEPVLNVTPGQQNELMLLRACLKYDPLFPKALLGEKLIVDGSGQGAVVSTTAFVQEPL
ncbi:MAG: TadE/TadG family type IV pilus assembly protein [Pseudomonadota bacterium]